jgi:mercuric ion transport protein
MASNKTFWSTFAGVLAAIGASICCAGPLILLTLGVSGAWIANLTELEPYRPIFIVLVVLFFSWAGWQLFRPVNQCQPEMACELLKVRKKRIILFFISLIISICLVTSPYWIIYLV